MPTVNTGFRKFNKLVKVTNDNTNRPLDSNNRLVSVTGLAQHIKDNLTTDTDYIQPVLNIAACPIPIDATVTEWSEWTVCINNTQVRNRAIITPAMHGGNTPVLQESRGCTPIPETFAFKWIASDPECVTTTI